MSIPADLAIGTPSEAPGGAGSLGAPEQPVSVRGLEIFAAFAAGVLPVAIAPQAAAPTFTPKLAILLLVIAVGLPRLVAIARRSPQRAPARAALAFLAAGLVSTLASKSILVGTFGLYSWGTGLLFWCGVAAAWAIGTQLGRRGRELVVMGLLVGTGANALLAVVQVTVNLPGPVLGRYDGAQADGFMGNPVYLEPLLLGALAILLVRCCRHETTTRGASASSLALVALFSGALELTGERFAVALLVLLAAYALGRFRSRRALAYAVTLVAGYALVFAATSTLLRERLTTVAGTTSNPRLSMWHVALSFLGHHLLLGAGPGEFSSAILSVGSLMLTRRLPVATYFADGHDVFVQVAVSCGLAGLVCFLTFLVLCLGRASGPLLGFCLLGLAVELIEPLNVAVTPLVFLALGAAARPAPAGEPVQAEVWPGKAEQAPNANAAARHAPAQGRSLLLIAQAVLVIIAVVIAAVVVYGDIESGEGLAHYDYAEAARGAQLLGVWSDPASVAAEVAADHGFSTSPAAASPSRRRWFALALKWREVAVRRDPTSPEPWVSAGDAELLLGATSQASSDFHAALAQDRWATHALVALGSLAEQREDWADAIRWFALALKSAPHLSAMASDLATAERHRKG